MFHPSSDYAPSRPFKIFISLLDKWEIGSQLTEALVVDSFKALKSSIETGTDTGEEVSIFQLYLTVPYSDPLDR